jgi:hypothetical protein
LLSYFFFRGLATTVFAVRRERFFFGCLLFFTRPFFSNVFGAPFVVGRSRFEKKKGDRKCVCVCVCARGRSWLVLTSKKQEWRLHWQQKRQSGHLLHHFRPHV